MNEAASAVNGTVERQTLSRSTALPLFFRQIEAVDSNRHRSLRRRPRTSWRFAAQTNAVPLGYSEIQRASQEYPIVFAADGEILHVVAIVGLTADSSLFVDAGGRWLGRYVPAYLRTYPFAFARIPGQAPNTFTVAMDTGSPELSTRDGTALFTETGEQSSHLVQVVEFLREYNAQAELARIFAARLQALGILQDVNAVVRMRSGDQHALTGMRVVERSALKGLSAAARTELFDCDWLEAIYHHLASLQTFSQLVDRLALRNKQ